MSQIYTDPKRESDPHALPNAEVFYVGTARGWNGAVECFACGNIAIGGAKSHGEHIGWYWVACFPGCLADGDPVGPFATEAEAIADAQDGCDDE